MRLCHVVLLIGICPALAELVHAETINLPEAVSRALARYPAVRASRAQADAAAAAIRLARTSYLPRADMLVQANRATRNNVFGLLFPQPVVAPISGPVLPVNDLTSVWGSAVGFLVAWEPFDFGRRRAEVHVAEAGRERAQAAVERTQLDVAAQAADAYLTERAAQQTLQAAEASVQRARELERVVGALVQAELRPGVDASRARAEAAAAETQRIQAQQALAVAREELAQWLQIPAGQITTTGSRLENELPPESPGLETNPRNPVLVEQRAAVEESRARLGVLAKSYYPRMQWEGTNYARGTGARADGTVGGFLSGLGPNIYNWGAGVNVTFSVLDLPGLRIRREVEQYRGEAEQARLDQLKLELDTRVRRAAATLAGARLVAAQTPVQRESAQATLTQATARYRSGLISVVDVAEAQRLLAQAEIDEALSRLSVWRAALALAVAQGDLTPFLQQVR